MLLSLERRFIFFHVPKTGGTSIRTALADYETNNTDYWMNRVLKCMGIRVNHYFGGVENYRFRFHQQAKTASARLPHSIFGSVFKFCFVRNPWDLVYSNYNFIRSNQNHKRHRRVSRMDFHEFIPYAVSKEIGFQAARVSDRNGNLLVDFVGRFEMLQHDFGQVCQKLDLDLELPHRNRAPHQDYCSAYDSKTRRLVGNAYAEDIERFGYQFGDSGT